MVYFAVSSNVTFANKGRQAQLLYLFHTERKYVGYCGHLVRRHAARVRRFLGAALAWACLHAPPAAAFPGAEATLPAALEEVAGRPPAAAAETLRRAASSAAHSARASALLSARLGLIEMAAGRHGAAAALLHGAVGLPVHDYVEYHRAEALFHGGAYAEALEAWRRLIADHPRSDWRHRAHFRIGDALAGLGRTEEALSAWSAALARYPEYPARAPLRFAMARAEAARGRLERAAALYREIRKLDPGDPAARAAATALAELEAKGVEPLHPTPAERLAQALDLRKRKYYAEAIAALRAMLLEPDVRGEVRDDVEWNIARALWESEQFEASVTAFRAIIDSTRDVGRQRRALKWVGYGLERLGQFDEAADALARSSGRPEKPPAETLEDIAWLYFNNARYEKAASFFDRLPAKTPNLRWMRAWLAFRRGDHKAADAAFGALAKASRKSPDRYLYWQARVAQLAGQKARALDLYREVARRSSIGYYGYQARARLVEAGVLRAEPPLSVAGVSALDPAAEAREPPLPLLQGLVRRAGTLFPAAAEALDLAALGENHLAALRLRQVSDEVRAFRKAGLRGKALGRWRYDPLPYLDNRAQGKTGEWGRAFDTPNRPVDPRRGPALKTLLDGDFADLLGRAFRALDDPHYARRHGSGGRLPTPPEAPENRSAWARRFPMAFADVLGPKAEKYGVDPTLLWAFMTVESSYNPLAISRANARGLMQVMPQTGGLIADRMALRGFGPALLFEPEVVLEMAAWYVDALLEKFNGQSPLAIAAYNAGPHRVAAWLRRKGGLPMDEFIEEIPYDEAREYTKKVIRHWGLYRRIYAGRAGLSLDLRVDPAFKDNINF
jgi:soluble lytic murein transglycosylase